MLLEMTRLGLFHTDATHVPSRLPGRLAPPLPQQRHMARAYSTHRWGRSAPPSRIGSRGLALSTLMNTNNGGLHLQHETLECNIHSKQMKYLEQRLQHMCETYAISR
jgi:hypothetical protein